MLKSFIKSIKEFIAKYLEKGVEVLLNCRDYPEYHEILSNLKLVEKETFGIRSNNLSKYFKEGKINYFNITEDNSMCVGVFCLAKGTKLSLHDHPGMMVFSKVLCGKIHRRNMDLVDRSAQYRLAKKVYQDNDFSSVGTILDAELVSDNIYGPGDILNLAPNKGNIHSFFALEDTAFMDVLLPNYDNEERFCNFYYELDTESDNSDEEMTEKEIKVLKKIQKVEQSKKEDFKGGEKEKQIVKLVYAMPPSDFDVVLLEYDGDSLV